MSPGPQDALPVPPEGFEKFLAAQPGFGVPLSDTVVSVVAVYLAELDRWRRKTNLTGHLSARELARHALESVLPIDIIVHGERVVDIGSGAGLPGLPLAIARRDLDVTLVEPRRKRCVFLRHVARTLDLANVRVLERRIEEVGGQTFGVATTRAVGNFAQWLRGAGFLDPGGRILAWTTERRELAEALGPSFELERSIPIPGSAKRQIAVFRKREA